MYQPLGGVYVSSPRRRWTFPNGATIDLSFIGEPGRWDGLEAAVIAIDQVEQITWEQFDSICGRNRSSLAVRPRVFCTANPPEEGPSHWLTRILSRGGWIGPDGLAVPENDGRVRYYAIVGDEFVFADSPQQLSRQGVLVKDRQGREIPPKSLTFVQALVDDHPDRAAAEQYKRELASKGEVERERRLYGNWYAIEGAGKYFKREYFRLIDYEPRESARLVRSWDSAWSTSETADWTPGVLVSLEPSGFWTVLDLLRIRGTYRHVERAIKLIAELDGRGVIVRLPKDAGAAGGLQSELARWLGARGYEVVLTADRGDKIARSRPYQACAERREVRLARTHPSREVAERLTEPFSTYDSDGTEIVVEGLDVSNVSTLHGWHESFLSDHIRFGRDTLNKRHIKKDVVDAAVGAYEVLTSTAGTDPADADDETVRAALLQAQRDLGSAPRRGGSIGFGGGGRVRGGGWL
jgi:phage terminase large subunit-like protein